MSKPIRESLDFQSSTAKIINLPTPTSAGDAANKAYVDALIAGLNYIEQPVRVGLTSNVNTASPGATLDGVTMSANDRVLLAGQTTSIQNGTWVWNGAAVSMTRSNDTFRNGTVVVTSSDGTSTNASSQFLQTFDNPVVGTTAITFIKLPSAAISAGTGLTQSGNVISLTSPVTVSLGGTGGTTAAAALASLGAARPNETDIGDGSSSSFTFNTAKSVAKYPVVQIVNNSTGQIEDASVTITPGSPTGGVYTPSIVVTAESWVATPPASNAYHVTVEG